MAEMGTVLVVNIMSDGVIFNLLASHWLLFAIIEIDINGAKCD